MKERTDMFVFIKFKTAVCSNKHTVGQVKTNHKLKENTPDKSIQNKASLESNTEIKK